MTVDKTLLDKALKWFYIDEFGPSVVAPIGNQFPNFPLPREIQAVLQRTENLSREVQTWQGSAQALVQVGESLSKGDPDRLPLFKQIVLLYRRHRAAETERLTEKTFHLEFTETLEQEVKALDALVKDEWFQQIETRPLPRLKDFLPVQFIEAVAVNQIPFLPRQYDQKFPILQAPNLFLPDLAYFRAKCEDRAALLAIAYFDIDHFKPINIKHTETKVDRNLLPLFMQTVEAHVFHHGYAYHEGGDEFMILIPSLSRSLSIAFLDELRCKLANLQYPYIEEKTTVSIGLCIVEPNCPLTDRELRDRASQAKKFAKNGGRNCIATYKGARLVDEELEVVRPQPS